MDSFDIDERFFNLDQAAIANIHEFKRSPDPALVPPILEGIIRNYLPEDTQESAQVTMESSFASLGLDSLTLLEAVLDLQDAFGVKLTNEDLRELRTVGSTRDLVLRKLDSPQEDQSPSTVSPSAL